jgi:hypothetical protein
MSIPVTVLNAKLSPLTPLPPCGFHDSSDELGERMKKYEEWIHTAQVKTRYIF